MWNLFNKIMGSISYQIMPLEINIFRTHIHTHIHKHAHTCTRANKNTYGHPCRDNFKKADACHSLKYYTIVIAN